jgi:uncharacterized protein (TIGR02646 family)
MVKGDYQGMIKVQKSAVGPDKLRIEGQEEAEVLKRAYDAGERDFGNKFKKSIYAHPTVKAQILLDQNNKCCFCEAIAIQSADVEHFRPKGKVSDAPQHPGYYWLAYEWTNLLGCCSTCNSRAKNFLFPLVDPNNRVNSHHGNIAQEEPLFVHPVHDEPTQHLTFDKFTVFGMTDKGRQTAQKEGVLDLNRLELLLKRRELWMDISDRVNTLLLLRRAELEGHIMPTYLRQHALQTEEYLKKKCDPTQPFLAMVFIEVERLHTLTKPEKM